VIDFTPTRCSVPDGVSTLETDLEYDDEISATDARMQFIVSLDGRVPYLSPEMQTYKRVADPRVSVQRLRHTTLVASARGFSSSDHAGRGTARLVSGDLRPPE